MPVRISDLLDGWEDGSTELPTPAGMSPERIREMTMRQVRERGRPRRRMGLRMLACAGLAAVFTVSAMAAYRLWGPEELSFSSLSLDYRITYDNPEAVDLSDLGIYLVLTDGSRVSVDCGTGFLASGSIQGTTYFDAPVPLEQVDHVLFGDIRLELSADTEP